MLELSNFYVLREDYPLFKPISQSFLAGEIWHLQGPNGQGKTTLLRALMDIFSETKGNIHWAQDIRRLYIGHKNSIQPSFTVAENIEFLFKIHNLLYTQDILYNCLDALGLSLFEESKAYALSAGQFRKIAFSLVFHPHMTEAVWILDEPFTALDRATCELIEQAILKQANTKGLVIMTSHQSNVSKAFSNAARSLHLMPIDQEAVSHEAF